MMQNFRDFHNIVNQDVTNTVGLCADTTEIMDEADPCLYNNTTLSVIIRFHKAERLSFLDEALFSLAIQYWHELETVVVIQNGTNEMKAAVTEMINRQPWLAPPCYKVLTCEILEGVDGRSSLLNHGIANASGRYLAFLDDDDVIYQHGYATLIQQLVAGGHAIAVGGCRTAKIEYASDHWFVKIKEKPFDWGRTRLDLFKHNFIPIHSYVIDRSRIGAFELYFDDELAIVEDYDFLLRFCATFEPDLSKLAIPVCEYRLHGMNSIPYNQSVTGLDPSAPNVARIQRLVAIINEKKKQYTCALPLSELTELSEMRIQLEKLQYEHKRLAYRVVQAMDRFLSRRTWLAKFINRLIKMSS